MYTAFLIFPNTFRSMISNMAPYTSSIYRVEKSATTLVSVIKRWGRLRFDFNKLGC
jgi:hypothetical protein